MLPALLPALLLLAAALGSVVVAAHAGDDEGAATPTAPVASVAAAPTSTTSTTSTTAPTSTAGDAAPAADAPLCAAPQPGFLSVATTPWTAVSVDGARVGTTPLFRLPLAPGAHVVEFVNERYGVVAREEVVVGEAELRKLKLVFLTAAHPEAALNESRAEDARDEEDCVATDGEVAFLSVDVRPWARVFVDGRATGTTPLFRHRLRPGSHRVRLQGPRGEHAAARFDATAQETVKLSLSFAAPPPSFVGDAPPAFDADGAVDVAVEDRVDDAHDADAVEDDAVEDDADGADAVDAAAPLRAP